MKVMKAAKFIQPFLRGGRKLMRFSTKHSNWILAAIAMCGVAGTAAAFTDATIKAVKLCEEKQVKGTKEVIKTVWKLYLPGIGCVIATTVAIATNAHVNAKRFATVTSLLAASQTDLEILKKKTREIVGEGKAQKIENAAESEKIDKDVIPSEDQIIHTGHGDDLFKMAWTGVYFRASPEWIELAFERFNRAFDSDFDDEAIMNSLLEEIGLPACESGNAYWSKGEMLRNGYKEVAANITSCKWTDIHGHKEMVSTLRCKPNPMFL